MGHKSDLLRAGLEGVGPGVAANKKRAGALNSSGLCQAGRRVRRGGGRGGIEVGMWTLGGEEMTLEAQTLGEISSSNGPYHWLYNSLS